MIRRPPRSTRFPRHDALQIFYQISGIAWSGGGTITRVEVTSDGGRTWTRSEEHTSELQSLAYLVCRLLLEKKKDTKNTLHHLLSEIPQSKQRLHHHT